MSRAAILSVVVALGSAGCSTLMNGDTQAVNIRTNPSGAICDVTAVTPSGAPSVPGPVNSYYADDRPAQQPAREATQAAAGPLASVTTPGVVVLARKHQYSVSCQLPGHRAEPQVIRREFKEGLSFTVGNLFFGGLIPGMIADSITGAAYELTPRVLVVKVEPEPTASR